MSKKRSAIQILLPALILLLSYAVASFSADRASGLVAPGATIKTVQSGFSGTEGPAADAEGNIYFTEKSGNSIQKWTWKDNKISLYKKLDGGGIGMMFDAKGRLVICEFSGRVTRDDLNGNVTVLADSVDGKKLHIPNDLWIDPKGGIYFSDFAFLNMGGMGGPSGAGTAGPSAGGAPSGGGMPGAAGGQSSGAGMPGQGTGGAPSMGGAQATSAADLGICYISPDGKKVSYVIKGINPNGLIGSSDGKTLYATGETGISSYKINADGTLSDKKVFCDASTDGMAIDEKGNVYLIGDAITVYNPKGEKIEEITLPEQKCKNLKFGGKDRKTLFICGNTAVYTLEMSVRGASAPLDLIKSK